MDTDTPHSQAPPLSDHGASTDPESLLSDDAQSGDELHGVSLRTIDPTQPGTGPNAQKPEANTHARLDDQLSSLSHLASQIRLDGKNDGSTGGAKRNRDKSDRATVEQVLDPRTRTILLKLVRRGFFKSVNGCISTGKEANVYYVERGTDDTALNDKKIGQQKEVPRTSSYKGDYAIKIYKTSILSFKTRAKYVDGSSRFRGGWHRPSNWASVKIWAEKEFRNLRRLEAADLPAPKPILLKSHVLVMEFIGSKDGQAAPRLEDVTSDDDAFWADLYVQTLAIMRSMFQQCKLVHADLSSYNLIVRDQNLVVFDVGQSVEQEHPKALEFLRVDIKNMTIFFGKKGTKVLSERATYAYVTGSKGESHFKQYDSMKKEIQEIIANFKEGDDEDDEVFRQQYLPRTLDQVYDIERDAEQIGRGEGDDLVYKDLLAGRTDGEEQEADFEAESDNSGSGEDSDDEDLFKKKQPRGKRFQDKDAKKEHKQEVKKSNREAREHKLPKHIKKKLINSTSRRKN